MRCPAAALGILAALTSAATESEAQAPSHGAASRNEPFLLIADEVQYDEDLGLTIAKGHVEISQDKQIILADIVTYNKKTDTLTASGHVSLLDPSGDVVFASYAELQDKLKDGFVKDVRALLLDRSRVAGNTGLYYAGNRIEVRRAVYSPCNICQDDPSRPPFWQIKAEQAVHDDRLQQVEFRNATMELGGVPVFFTPYLSLPDPNNKRVSGFLDPTFGHSSTLGFRAQTPYYWVIAPDKDMTLDPLVTTAAGSGLGLEYRQRWGDGFLNMNGSFMYTNQQVTSTGSSTTGGDVFRGSIFSQSEFDIDENWRTSLNVQRTSDQTYLQQFNFPTGVTGVNLTTAPYLVSRGDVENFDDRAYTLFDSYLFQSQQATVGNSTQPVVIPDITYNWISHPDDNGARWSFNSNVFNSFSSNGIDMRRLSTTGAWSIPFDGLIGDRFTFTSAVRADTYYSSNFMTEPNGPLGDAVAGRFFPQAKLEWHYPWIRHGGSNSEVIEPIVALIASPIGWNPPTIPNQDSQDVDWDDTRLFAMDRFPGYDRVDSGQRVDYGIHGAIYGNHGGSTSFLVGQSYRFQNVSAFPTGSGLEDRTSDVVGRLTVSPGSYLDLIYRFRLDHNTLTPKRQEVTASGGPPSLRVNVSFISITQDPNIVGFQALRQITGNATIDLTRNWTFALFGTQNINSVTTVSSTPTTSPAFAPQPATLGSGVALSYHNECITITGAVGHSNTHDLNVVPGTTVLFTIAFKNIGSFNFPLYSTGNTTGLTIPSL